MGVLKKVKLSVVLAALMLAFQNCGNKGNFSANADETLSELAKSEKEDQVGAGAGEFEVVSYSHSVCKSGSCVSGNISFQSKQTIIFKNGSLSGRAACNGFGGKYALTIRPNEGTNLIKISALVSTLMACDQLAEEKIFLNNLPLAYKITDLTKNTVDIYTSLNNKEVSESGTFRLRRKVVVPEPVTSIVGNYKIISLTNSLCKADMKYNLSGPCMMQTTKFKSAQTISFLKGGVVSGKAACNLFNGSYKFEDRAKEPTELLSLSGLVSTQAACTLIAEEQALFDALAKVYKVEIGTSQVQLLFAGGSVVLQKIK